MTDNSATLLPCPFCGGEAKMCHVTQIWEPKDSYWVKCGDCHTSGKHHRTETEAITAWNTRAPEQAIAATLGGEQICHATQENYGHCKYSTNRGWCDTSRYAKLFGTPERAARTLITVREECEDIGACYPNCPFDDAPACPSSIEPRDYDDVVEWLRGDA